MDEVDLLTDGSMKKLKSFMNTPNTVFIMTTNYLQKVDVGVQDRSHCIPFNGASPEKWLPLARRILGDAGIGGIPDALLIDVIATGKGSARKIVDADL